MKKGACHHQLLPKLKRIEGQIRGVQKMIEDRRYCVDILNTVSAAIGALKSLEAGIFKDHLEACVKTAWDGKSLKEKNLKLKEIYSLLRKTRR